MQLTSTARAQFAPDKKLSVTAQLEHQLLDDNSTMERAKKFRQDFSAWLVVYYRPDRDTRVRARIRYLDEASNDNTYLERSVAALADVALRVRDRDILRIRLDTKFWLDKRMNTTLRVPDPELGLWLFYEAKL